MRIGCVGYLEELIDRYLKGDSQACEELLSYPEHQQRVERIARKNTRGTSVSWEDAAQDAHLKVFQVAINRQFRWGGVRDFYCWAAAVAYHKVIDLVRREKRKQQQWRSKSLNQLIPETDIPLWETIADDLDLWDAVECADLVSKAVAAISKIDQRYPCRGYLKLWQGRVQDKKQSQLAVELGVSQGEISKRWKELLGLIAAELGFLQTEVVKRNLKATRKQRVVRQRSDIRW